MEKVEFSLEGFEDREADNYEEESLRVIISDASDLDELEQEWKDFMSMPKSHRIDSDRESIELYGKTNEERYREQKAKFLNSRKEDTPKEYKGVTEESEYRDPKYQNPPKELEQYRDRFKLFDPKAKELARRWVEDSMIPMVIPYGSWEDLDKMWNDVCSVSMDKRTKSDTKCMELFGMKNEELYNFMTNQLNCVKSIESELMKHPEKEHGPSEENVSESYIEEMKRSDLKDSEFGLPKLRKYPMPDKDHVLSAIKFFNYVSPENEKELAKNIKKKMKQYNVSSDHIGDKNRLKKYIKEEYELEEAYYNISNGMNIEESFELLNDYEPKNIYESTLLELAGSDDTVECTGDTLWAEMPFFSPDEMINYGVFSGEGNRFFPIADNNTIGKLTTEQWFKEYYTRAKGISTMAENIQSDWIMTLNKLYMDYDNLLEFGTDDEINARKQSILELGWNPNIPFTPENRVKATKNTIKKIKENYNNFSIIRVRGGEESNIIEETVQNKDKYPVSIVLIKGNSLLAKTITKVTKSNVSHVAICLDDNLKKLYSFNARGEFNGLSYESFNSYKKDGVKEAIVFTFFLKKDQYKMLEKNIEYYILNQNKTKYSFINLASIPLNVSVGFDMKMVCSEFVDRILKLSNIDFTGKKFTLVTPNDIYTSIKNNSKVYLIYQGALDKLNVNKAVNKIKKLAKSANLLQEYYMNESLVFSKNDLYWNFDKFKNGKSNILLVTGLSGSGKSTLGKQLASQYKAEYIELDCIADIKDKDKPYILQEWIKTLSEKELDNFSKDSFRAEVQSKFLDFCIRYAKNNKDKKFIIEGIQIYELYKDKARNYPLIIKGTSALKSFLQKSIKREKWGYKEFLKYTKEDLSWLIKSDKDLDQLKNSLNESYIIISEKGSPNKLYHLSKSNLDNKTLIPRIPSNFLVNNGYEDDKTKRVCFSSSIDKALRAMSQNLKGMKLYVHVPDKYYDTYTPTLKEVPDSKITGEIWIKQPVKLKCIGQIEVIKDKGEEGIKYKYGNNTAELYDWDWRWINTISESNDESYIDKNHKQNGQKRLSDFKFSKTKNNDEGKSYNLYWKDDNDKLVGKVTVDTIPASDGYRWFGNLEVSKKYRGYGLGKQILDIAVKKYKAGALAVYKDNEIAYNMYKKYGFKNATDRNSKDYHYMYLERNRDKSIKESYIPVLEVKEFPVQFDEDGNLLIKNIKRIDFEKEYSNAHRLLMAYDKNKNTEGMKYELAKLQFLNDILENHIYYDKKSIKKDYYVKVRARILNDFNKYLSVLLKLEPLFVFGEYYQSTPFSDAVIKIRSSTLKHGIQLIKSLF